MERDLKDSPNDNNVLSSTELDEDKSFVKKVKTKFSGLFNSSLSRLFKSDDELTPIRKRSDEDDVTIGQPPLKRVKSTIENDLIHRPYQSFDATPGSSQNHHIFNNFVEPQPGPSGYKPPKVVTNVCSKSNLGKIVGDEGHLELDSDSGESTSGYSSMALSKKKDKTEGLRNLEIVGTPKTVGAGKNDNQRSLFSSESLMPPESPSLSSRRPSFNASTLGNPNFIDRTISTNKIINSPFYNGRTIYGGASAYGRQFGRTPAELRNAAKNSFIVRPINATSSNSSSNTLSKTAKRILNTLEQYSTPVSDAKKIPLPTKPPAKEGLLSRFTAATPYARNKTMRQELLVPTVPELLQMKQRERLQDSTVSVRKLATNSKSDLNEEYKLPSADDQEKHSNKMKTKMCGTRLKAPAIEILEDVVLKPVDLPITNLPSFNFVVPPPSSVKSILEKEESSNVPPAKSAKLESKNLLEIPQTLKSCFSANIAQNENKVPVSNKLDFKFSEPVVIADNLKSIIAINNFKFSEPLSKLINRQSEISTVKFDTKESKLPKKKNNGELDGDKSSSIRKESSNGQKGFDTFASFKPPEGTWECDTCLIRNKGSDLRCVACESKKPDSNKVVKARPEPFSSGFGTLFSKKSDEWECDSCFVRNKASDNSCVACANPKPSVSNQSAPKASFGFEAFKTPTGTWKCDTCLIQNKHELSKCAACESPKPNGLSNHQSSTFNGLPSMTWDCAKCKTSNKAAVDKCSFCKTSRAKNDLSQPSASTWDCPVCLIQNKSSNLTCAACQAQKPGAQLDNKFAKKSNDWECPACMVRNSSAAISCVCCTEPKPGLPKVDKDNINVSAFGVKSTFTFGVPEDKRETSEPKKVVFNIPSTVAGNSNFSFGVPAAKTSDSAITISNISFGVPGTTTPSFSFNAKSPEKVSPLESVTTATPNKEILPTNTVALISTPSFASTTKTVTEIKMPTFNLPTTDMTNMNQRSTNNKRSHNGDEEKSSASKSPMFQFNANTPLAGSSTELSKPLFQFKPPQSEGVTSLNTTLSNKPFAFSAKTEIKQNIAEPSKPVFQFGSSHANNPSEAKTFGSISASFSNKNLTMNKTEDGEGPTKKALFSFGSVASNPNNDSQKQAMFSFGSCAASSNPSNPPVKPGGFSFSAPGANNPTPASANLFEKAIPTNGGFNFGSPANNNNQKAGFSFGAVSSPQQPAATAGKFNFGSSATSSSGGFNFAAPAFDASAKPTFNFTGGNVPSFTAQTNEGGQPNVKRVMKRAVRKLR